MKAAIFPVEPLKLSCFDSTIRVNQFPKGKQTNTTPLCISFDFILHTPTPIPVMPFYHHGNSISCFESTAKGPFGIRLTHKQGISMRKSWP